MYHQGFNLGCNFAEAVNYSAKLELDGYRECTKDCTSFPPITKASLLPQQPIVLSQQGKRGRPPGDGGEKPLKKPRIKSSSSSDFANPSAMADLLRKAIAAKRTADRLGGKQPAVTDIKELWRLLSCGSQLNHLQRIFIHERYSRGWIELSEKAARIKIKKKTFLMDKLGIQTENSYLNAFKAAQRGMVWVRLCDIFEKEFKDDKFVALCAFTGSCSMCIIISQDELDINFNT